MTNTGDMWDSRIKQCCVHSQYITNNNVIPQTSLKYAKLAKPSIQGTILIIRKARRY